MREYKNTTPEQRYFAAFKIPKKYKWIVRFNEFPFAAFTKKDFVDIDEVFLIFNVKSCRVGIVLYHKDLEKWTQVIRQIYDHQTYNRLLQYPRFHKSEVQGDWNNLFFKKFDTKEDAMVLNELIK